MDFTFGIITDGSADGRIDQIVASIQALNIPAFEIIVVGNTKARAGVRNIAFDEGQKPKWITRKKNVITENALFENIVYLHDYITFDQNWYAGWSKFGDYKAAMNPIYTFEGQRFRDWTLCPDTPQFHDPLLEATKTKVAGPTWHENLLPYSETSLSRFMYFSGSYWVAKKHVMTEFPLNETLVWGQGEDLEWSQRVRKKYNFSINVGSTVRILKPHKDIIFTNARPELIQVLREAVNA